MKKILTFIPLGVGISAAIIYILNIINFRIINNSTSMLKILYNLRIYLYVSIFGFIIYFFIRVLSLVNKKEKTISSNSVEQNISYKKDDSLLENNANTSTVNNSNIYIPNYDYVPLYNKEKSNEYNNSSKKEKEEIVDESVVKSSEYCIKCGSKILNTDKYCYNCGTFQDRSKKMVNPIIKKIINIIEILILILIVYFSLNILFNYKEKVDNNFKSPFKINMTR